MFWSLRCEAAIRSGFFILKIYLFLATKYMLLLTEGNATDNIIVTLNESKTITSPFYHFVFTNVTTNEQVIITKESTDDLSLYPDRYNEFQIATATDFLNKSAGQWNYIVYESLSVTYDTGLNVVELGKMLLQKSTELTISGSEITTTYKGYGR